MIQIDIDPNEVGATVRAEIGMVSDAGTALAALAEHAPSSPRHGIWPGATGPTSTPARYPRIVQGKASTPRGSSAPCAKPCLRTLY